MPLLRHAVVACTLVAGLLPPAFAQTGADKDPIRAVLLESKEKNRGVTIHSNGSTISAVVVQVDDQYVIGRSNASSRIVVRLDRIDGVVAGF